MLHLKLFGPSQIEQAGLPITPFKSRKVEALLFYLALNSGQHSRSQLAGLLWSEMPEDKALSNLRFALWNLRQILGAVPLTADRLSVTFRCCDAVWVDVNEFRRLLRLASAGSPAPETIANLEQAGQLYRGDFLAGFELGDAPLFNEWLDQQRVTLYEMAVDLFTRLGAYHATQQHLPEAIAATRRLLEMEPWQEATHRQMMLLLTLAGRRGAALEHYQQFRQKLATELDFEPEPETIALWERIRSGQPPGQGRGPKPIGPADLAPVQRGNEQPGQVGEWLTSFYPHSHEIFKLLTDLQQAGQQAQAAYELPLALERYQQALRHWETLYHPAGPDTPLEIWRQRWELLLRQAEVSQWLGQLDQQRLALEMAAREIAAWGDDGDQLQVIVPQLAYLRQAGELERCRALAREGLALARSLFDRLAEGDCLQALADGERDAANYAQALEYYEAALINFSQLKQTHQAAFCLINVGRTYLMTNRFARAIACLKEAVAYAQAGPHPDSLVWSSLRLAYAYLLLGDWEKARVANQEALAASDTSGLHPAIALGLGLQGYLELLKGNLAQAQRQFEQAWTVAQEAGHPQAMADIQCYMGHLYLAQAEPRQALAHFEQAQRLCGPIALHRAIEALSYRAVAYLALGQTEPALDCSDQAIDWLLKRKGGLEAAQRVYLNHYRVLLTGGLTAQAQAALATAHKMVLAQAAELAPALLAAEPTDMVRERFLTRLPWNREIMATAERVLLSGQSY